MQRNSDTRTTQLPNEHSVAVIPIPAINSKNPTAMPKHSSPRTPATVLRGHDETALLAHRYYEEEGRPDGRSTDIGCARSRNFVKKRSRVRSRTMKSRVPNAPFARFTSA